MSQAARANARRCTMMLGTFAAVLALGLGMAGSAVASQNFGGMVPPKSVSFSPAEGNTTGIIAERYSGEGSICAGPATFPGPNYPYGFQCAGFQVVWGWPTLKAHGAIDNPNSKTVGITALVIF